MRHDHLPERQGLYDPGFERDSCGVGFVCDVNGDKSYDVVDKAMTVLERMSHRGAVGADPKTGDGAGILISMPHGFLEEVCRDGKIDLPEYGKYGSGIIFLPRERKDRVFCEGLFEKYVKSMKMELLGWRDVPVDDSIIGKSAKETEPVIKQIFIADKDDELSQDDLERKLYVVKKQVENAVRASGVAKKRSFYVTGLSSKTLVYKGLLMPDQVRGFFPDLKDPRVKSSLALVHSRYSTNTFPTWDLAQPFRFLAHNGEINTLRGNINWMHARESLLASPLFGKNIEKIKPIVVEGLSDSATLDNVFELLVLSGRSLEHSMMMLIPEAWEENKQIDKELLEFYKYHSCLMEPWDGPAAIAFTDGTSIGAVLDRNGLRPAKYIVTKGGMVVMASEMGVLDIEPSDIALSGRLEPGKMFFINTEEKRIIGDAEIKKQLSALAPYGEWNEAMVDLDDLKGPKARKEKKGPDTLTSMKAFGYTRDDIRFILKPMAEDGKEPVGSMGNDTPHAVLSKKAQPLYNYFKQLFAQVTNPPIDPIREELVMSLEGLIGKQGNVLAGGDPGAARKLRLKKPVLTDAELAKIKNIKMKGFKTRTISILFDADDKKSFKGAIDRVCREALSAIKEGCSFVVLSDKGFSAKKAAIPALLAASAVHHHLVMLEKRTSVGLIVESAEPREVHHFAVLFGYGADAVNPYLAYEVLGMMAAEKEINVDAETAVYNYRKALGEGILKILSKMGISTLRSYKGAQIFEALGVSEEVTDKYFTGTVSRIGGVTLDGILEETLMKHSDAYSREGADKLFLEAGGKYQWKKDGEFHLWNPDSIEAMQTAVRENSYDKFKKFAGLINDQSANPTTLRGLLRFKKTTAIPLSEVEPVEEIVKRFATGAMSFGSISKHAHESLAIAMNRLGGKSNTGEGGEDPARFTPMINGDSARSAIKQVASGRFGVTTNYLANADELQIKMAQGAKPGEGGQLPGHKVSEIIARTRYTTAGVTLISPPPHHDIYSIEDLAQLIYDLKNVNPGARISVKLVSEVGVGTIAAGVAKGHADMILISGGDGGTGASPRSSIMHAGLPWELGIAETHQTLVLNDLRGRVRLQADGQMRTGRDVAIAALLGAEEYGFCTAALITLGCVMLRHCHLNNCAVGVATQDPELERKFCGNPDHVVNFMRFVARELREIMAELGVRTIHEMIGRTDLLEVNREILPWKAKGLDLSRLLHRPRVAPEVGTKCISQQDHNVERVLDRKLINIVRDDTEKGKSVRLEERIANTNRTTGAMLSGGVCKRFGEKALPDGAIHCKFKGIAGQSFGAFLAKGITFELEGIANDYVGKGISGGRIIIYPDRTATYDPTENVIIGNTTFYGAIAGEAYIKGVAGERFCVRNSGLNVVVEGVGDHGCEYMTGGRVVVIGKTGRNFAAGMSGGIAYVYDPDGKFSDKCNKEMVFLEKITEEDSDHIKHLLNNHIMYTDSRRGRDVLAEMNIRDIFVKIFPKEYKNILEARKQVAKKSDLTEVLDG
jgi:glutamate synthase domain-containing protein 2/glutamate synthase domain-containing protein 1/glutamate synthase domain-containing protein 3